MSCSKKNQQDIGLTEATTFMDGTSNVLLLEDVFWYLTELVEIGCIYGVILNFKTTKILTAIVANSLFDFHCGKNNHHKGPSNARQGRCH
eukprot:7800211-Ditylum_brightwellii.AAC.2